MFTYWLRLVALSPLSAPSTSFIALSPHVSLSRAKISFKLEENLTNGRLLKHTSRLQQKFNHFSSPREKHKRSEKNEETRRRNAKKGLSIWWEAKLCETRKVNLWPSRMEWRHDKRRTESCKLFHSTFNFYTLEWEIFSCDIWRLSADPRMVWKASRPSARHSSTCPTRDLVISAVANK